MRQYAGVTALRDATAYDPAELIRAARDALRRPGAAAGRARRLRHWSSSTSYQDTDPAQDELLRLVAAGGRELVVVGDPDQSIYSFRGADGRHPAVHPTFPRRRGAGADRDARDLAPVRADAAGRVAAGRRAAWPARSATASLVAARRARRGAGAGRPAARPSAGGGATSRPGCARRTCDGVPGVATWRCWCGRRSAALPRAAPGDVAAGVPLGCRQRRPAAGRLSRRCGRCCGCSGRHLAGTLDEARAPSSWCPRRWAAPTRCRCAGCCRPCGRSSLDGAAAGRRAAARRGAGRPGRPGRPGRRGARPARAVADAAGRARGTRPPSRAPPPRTVLWDVWSASGLASRWERASLTEAMPGEAADRDLDAVVALFETAARFSDRLPAAGPEVFLDHSRAADPWRHAGARGAPRADAVQVLTAHAAKGLEWDVVVVAGVQEGGLARPADARLVPRLGAAGRPAAAGRRAHRDPGGDGGHAGPAARRGAPALLRRRDARPASACRHGGRSDARTSRRHGSSTSSTRCRPTSTRGRCPPCGAR